MWRWLSEQRAFRKMLSVILLIFLCIFGISTAINNYSRKILAGQLLEMVDGKAESWVNDLERQINSLLMIQSSMLTDDSVQKISVFWNGMSNYEKTEIAKKLSDRLAEVKILHSLVSDISVCYTHKGFQINGDMTVKETLDLEKMRKAEQVFADDTGIYLTMYYPVCAPGKSENSIYFIQSYISKENLTRILNDSMSGQEGQVFVLDETGTVITSSDQRRQETGFEVDPETVLGGEKQSGILSSLHEILTMNLQLLYCYPDAVIADATQIYDILTAGFAICSALLFVLYTVYAAKEYARPVDKIMKAMEGQDEQFLISGKKQDEFAYIYKRYNDSIERINRLLTEKVEAQYQTKMAQLRQLQYQIQPHFLYNSLFTISRMATLDENETIAEYTKNLGQYYEYITHISDRQVTVGQELDYLENYLYIQKTRFGSRIRLEVDEISEEIKNLKIVPLILQPLVENAYEHGVKEMESGGWIHISASYEDQIFTFLVEDNGVGVEEEELLLIRSRMEKQEINTEAIHGLTNTYARLHAIYGEDGALSVGAREEGGFWVRLNLKIEVE